MTVLDVTEDEALACFLIAAVPHVRRHSAKAESMILDAVRAMRGPCDVSQLPPRYPANLMEIVGYLSYALPDLEVAAPEAADRIRAAIRTLSH